MQNKTTQYNDHGFTLIEVLVSINVALLLVAMAYGFYLFAFKYSGSFLKSTGTKLEVNSFLSGFIRMLDSAPGFTVRAGERGAVFEADETGNMEFVEDSLMLKGSLSLSGIESYALTVTLNDGDSFVSEDGKTVNQPIFHDVEKGIQSHSIERILLELTAGGKKYRSVFINEGSAVRKFKNIRHERFEAGL